MEVLRKRYGDRFAEMPLERFRARPVEVGPDTSNCWCCARPRSTANSKTTRRPHQRTDHRHAEADPHGAPQADEHGFPRGGDRHRPRLLPQHPCRSGRCLRQAAGQLVGRCHDRCCLVGDGRRTRITSLMPAEKLGIRGDLPKVAVPRSMAAYRAGLLYFHGGASLQEAVVPVIVVRLHGTEQPPVTQAAIDAELQERRQEDHHAGAGDRCVGRRRQHVLAWAAASRSCSRPGQQGQSRRRGQGRRPGQSRDRHADTSGRRATRR